MQTGGSFRRQAAADRRKYAGDGRTDTGSETNGIAAFRVIAPDSYNFWTTPIVAAEPWISPVSTVPASKPSSGFSDIPWQIR